RPRDLADRSERDSAELSDALSDWICHRKKLIGLLVEEQMIIAKVRTTHVPVKIFRLHIERKDVRENGIHRSADVFGGRTRQIRSRREWCVASLHELQSLFRIRLVHCYPSIVSDGFEL